MTPARPRAPGDITAPGVTEVRRFGAPTAPWWVAVCVRCGHSTLPAELLSLALTDDDAHRRMHRLQTAEAGRLGRARGSRQRELLAAL